MPNAQPAIIAKIPTPAGSKAQYRTKRNLFQASGSNESMMVIGTASVAAILAPSSISAAKVMPSNTKLSYLRDRQSSTEPLNLSAFTFF